jgi:hypothetical protein
MPDEVKKQIDPSSPQDLNQVMNAVHEEGREALSKEFERAAAAKQAEPETVEGAEEKKREASPEGTPKPEEKKEAAPEPKKGEPLKRRFQTIEEYEKALDEKENAYKEVQSVASKQGERLKTLERTVEDKKDEEQWLVKVAEEEKKYVEYLEQRASKTLDDIDALEEDDPEYNAKVTKIRAAEFKDIKAYERAHPDLSGRQPRRSQPEARPEQEIPQEVREQAEKSIRAEASKHGIDPLNPKFREFCEKSPDKLDGKDLSFDEQLTWAIEQTKEFFVSQWRPGTSRPGNGSPPSGRLEQESPMGKGASFSRPKPEDRAEPVSIEKALGKVRQERTL